MFIPDESMPKQEEESGKRLVGKGVKVGNDFAPFDSFLPGVPADIVNGINDDKCIPAS
jgi:hypothetical protein